MSAALGVAAKAADHASSFMLHLATALRAGAMEDSDIGDFPADSGLAAREVSLEGIADAVRTGSDLGGPEPDGRMTRNTGKLLNDFDLV